MIVDNLVNEATTWNKRHNKPIIMFEYGADTIAGMHEVSASETFSLPAINFVKRTFFFFSFLPMSGAKSIKRKCCPSTLWLSIVYDTRDSSSASFCGTLQTFVRLRVSKLILFLRQHPFHRFFFFFLFHSVHSGGRQQKGHFYKDERTKIGCSLREETLLASRRRNRRLTSPDRSRIVRDWRRRFGPRRIVERIAVPQTVLFPIY